MALLMTRPHRRLIRCNTGLDIELSLPFFSLFLFKLIFHDSFVLDIFLVAFFFIDLILIDLFSDCPGATSIFFTQQFIVLSHMLHDFINVGIPLYDFV
jgi:hypothetical protein